MIYALGPEKPKCADVLSSHLQALLLRHALLCTHCTQGGVALLGGTATQAPFRKVGHMSVHKNVKQAKSRQMQGACPCPFRGFECHAVAAAGSPNLSYWCCPNKMLEPEALGLAPIPWPPESQHVAVPRRRPESAFIGFYPISSIL